MKRICILLALLLCAMLAFTAQAVEAKPGDTVPLTISLFSDNKIAMADFTITYDSSAFTLVSATAIDEYCIMGMQPNGGNYVVSHFPNIPDGAIGTVTLKVNEGAKGGTYSLGVIRGEAIDLLGEPVADYSFGLGGSITIKVDCKHTTTEEKVVKEPTCDATGTKQIVCSGCGEVMSTETIAKLGHSFVNYKESKAPTCTEKGKETAKCERCDKTDTRDILALGHDVADWTVTKEPTCTEKGIEESKCTRCGEGDTREIPALGHKEGEWKVTKEPTCTEKGVEESKCPRCGEAKTREIPALGHEEGEWKVTKEPTCTEKGVEESKCPRCGEAKTREIAALGHEESEWKVTKEPTCTEKGVEESKCPRCGEGDTREIPALGHKEGEWKVTKEPTCTEKGVEESKCPRCGESNTREIPALGHDVGEWKVTKPATCDEKGEETATCARCGKTDTREIPALGHDIGEWVVTKEATCTEDGAKYRECSRCDKREDVVILALGHNGVWKVIKPATGKEEGLKQKICKRCDEVLEEAVIPVLQIESRTACTAGIKASELVNLKADYDWWKMVTAIDLSVEGTTRYPLVAGNVYEIGYVEITVEEGVVTADLVVDAPTVTMYTNALIFLADPSEITFFDANFYEHYEFPATINVEDLPAEQVYMMVCSQLTIDLSKPEPKYYNFKGAEHAALVEQVNAIIAEMNAAE